MIKKYIIAFFFYTILYVNASAQIELTPYAGIDLSNSSGDSRGLIHYADHWKYPNYLLGAKLHVYLKKDFYFTVEAGYSAIKRPVTYMAHLLRPIKDISYNLFLFNFGTTWQLNTRFRVGFSIQVNLLHNNEFHAFSGYVSPTGEVNSSVLLGPAIDIEYKLNKIVIMVQMSYIQKDEEIHDFVSKIFRGHIGVGYPILVIK